MVRKLLILILAIFLQSCIDFDQSNACSSNFDLKSEGFSIVELIALPVISDQGDDLIFFDIKCDIPIDNIFISDETISDIYLDLKNSNNIHFTKNPVGVFKLKIYKIMSENKIYIFVLSSDLKASQIEARLWNSKNSEHF